LKYYILFFHIFITDHNRFLIFDQKT
jgi:hypothetical protein